METNKSSLLPSAQSPWNDNNGDIWLASTLTLHRNVAKFPFSSQLEASQRLQVLTFLQGELLKLPQLQNPRALAGNELQAVEKEFLLEHYLTSQSFNQAYVGDGFVVDATGTFLATVNLGEHLKLQLTSTSTDLIEGLEHLISLESQLGRTVNFAFSSKFGFLSADPMRCGTGLLVCCFLHLPALEELGILQVTLEKQRENTLEFFGLGGKSEKFIGSIVGVCNICSLGWSEEKITSYLHNAVHRLVVAEKNARAEILKTRAEQSVDHICRAYGLLRHSYQLHTSEALGALGLMKLALDLKWLRGTSQKALNRQLFQVRRAHLQLAHPQQKVDGLAHLRATELQRAFASIELAVATT